MTLDRHRSKLIPEIDFGGDGRLFVTDREGTFPLAVKKGAKERHPAPDYDEVDVKSFHSYDRRREIDRAHEKEIQDKRRRYRQNNQSRYEREIAAMSGTWSSGGGGSSLMRKVRRTQVLSRGDGKSHHISSETGSLRGSPLRGGTPKMSPLERGNPKRKSLDIEKLRRSSKKGDKTYFGRVGSEYSSNNGDSPLLLWDAPTKNRKISEERLPGLVFIVTGGFLIVLGVLRVFLSYWHEYFCALWTGVLAILFGISGIKHKGMYLSRRKNGAYISLGLLTTLATMASSGLVLHVLIPILSDLALGRKSEYVAAHVDFTNFNKSLLDINMDIEEVVWITLSLDFSSLIMFLVNFFAMTATMIAVGNHWDAEYGSTGECDHRGNPRVFNPLEQISVGQTSALFGCAAIVLQQSSQDHFWAPVWSGFVVMMSGFVSTCFGKRIDVKCLNVYAIVWELVSLLSCGAGIAVSTLALEDEVAVMENAESSSDEYKLSLASLVGHGCFLFMMVINVVYIFGIMFRLVRNIVGAGDCVPRKKPPMIESTTL